MTVLTADASSILTCASPSSTGVAGRWVVCETWDNDAEMSRTGCVCVAVKLARWVSDGWVGGV